MTAPHSHRRALQMPDIPALRRYGAKRFDRSTLLDERRYITRTLAGLYRKDATDLRTGELVAAGLRFTSRLPPAWECWATHAYAVQTVERALNGLRAPLDH